MISETEYVRDVANRETEEIEKLRKR